MDNGDLRHNADGQPGSPQEELKKGTYKVRIKVRAAGNSAFSAGTKTVTVKIVVK